MYYGRSWHGCCDGLLQHRSISPSNDYDVRCKRGSTHGTRSTIQPSIASSTVSDVKMTLAAREIEDRLLLAVQSVSRLDQSDEIDALVAQLESYSLRGVSPSIAEPAIAPEIYGTWRLLFTTNTASSSPIQRSAVNTDQFPIYQNINVVPNSDRNSNSTLIVSQVVQFNANSQLRVDALASTAAYPLPELTARQSPTTFGLSIFGTSLVGFDAQPNPLRPNSRIDFVFDSGEFALLDGQIKIPYPVPFRLPFFRDIVKGWIDITWMSDRLRISRGNKGSTFILIKES
jgi:hypothetical protein